MIKKEGSVRVDLLGGTLDLDPINLILEKAMTLSCATSLKAKVTLKEGSSQGVEIVSKDYNSTHFFSQTDFTLDKLRGSHFKSMVFVAQILDHFKIHSDLVVVLESGSPPGAGLGGSSAIGMTLFKALCDWVNRPFERAQAINIVQRIEARVLDSGPAGYQDYYPALYGGILALTPGLEGVEVEQLFSKALKEVLEKRLSLVYSGQTRSSGINNWEVYKNFFDKVPLTRQGLKEIAELSYRAGRAICEGEFDLLVELIKEEGKKREELFPGIVSTSVKNLYNDLKKSIPQLGMKVCGAGGGGCFLLIHQEDQKRIVRESVKKANMQVLDFSIEPPLK